MKCSSFYIRHKTKRGKPCEHEAVEGGRCGIHIVTHSMDAESKRQKAFAATMYKDRWFHAN